MNNITVRNIPENIHKKLKRRAEASHRSLNSEIIACLEEALLPSKIEIDKLLDTSERIQKKLNFRINMDELDLAKKSGRI